MTKLLKWIFLNFLVGGTEAYEMALRVEKPSCKQRTGTKALYKVEGRLSFKGKKESTRQLVKVIRYRRVILPKRVFCSALVLRIYNEAAII